MRESARSCVSDGRQSGHEQQVHGNALPGEGAGRTQRRRSSRGSWEREEEIKRKRERERVREREKTRGERDVTYVIVFIPFADRERSARRHAHVLLESSASLPADALFGALSFAHDGCGSGPR